MRRIVCSVTASVALLVSSTAFALPMPGPKTYGATQHPRTNSYNPYFGGSNFRTQ